MAFKYFALFAFVATVAAIELQHAYHHEEEHYAPAEYTFEYAVHDDHTGDIKSQQETRHGDKVEGHYTLIDADGYRRVVHYTSDKETGFNAKVEREYLGAQHEAPKQVKIVSHEVPAIHYSAPVVTKVAPAIHYTKVAPVVAKVSPVVYKSAPVVTKVVAHQVPEVKYVQHGDAQTHVSVQSHAVNYHY